jgi:hypothetical protein
MLFDTERSLKAPDVKTYEELTQKIESHTRYARKFLGVCTQELQIPERRVLQATREWATTQYTEFTLDVAESFDWVVSLVAVIPCIQVSTSTCAVPQQITQMTKMDCDSHTMKLQRIRKSIRYTKARLWILSNSPDILAD